MRTVQDRRSNAVDLLRVAESTAIPFESSSTGRWVRFPTAEGNVYVVRDAWDAGGIVMGVGGSGPVEVRRFANIREAVLAAASLARRDIAALSGSGAVRRAG